MAQGWERLASPAGGTVAALAAVADGTPDGTTIVFAATPVGVLHSPDGGQNWAATGGGSAVPFAVAVAPSPHFARDRTVFAGARDGVYRSTDGGAIWQRMLSGGSVLALALAPEGQGESVLFAGTDTDGILRSEDAGRGWASANPGLLDLTVLALAPSPRFERDRLGFAGTASGLYRTRNGGKSWREIELGVDQPSVQCLALSPWFSDDGLVLAGTEADGLLRSRDAGARWEAVPAFEGRSVTALAFSASDPARPTIAAATDDGVALSRDGGETWRTTGHELGPVLSLLFVPHGDGEVLLAGLPRDGVARSEDAGLSWSPAGDGPSARLLVGLTVSPAFAPDRTLFAADLQGGIVVSTDGGSTWEQRGVGVEDLPVSGLTISPDYARDRTVYAATSAGVRQSRDGGVTWQASGGDAAGPAVAVAVGRTPGNGPPTVLAALAGGKLIASDDGADTWRSLGEPFGGAEIVSIALESYVRDRTIFVATSGPTPDGPGELVLWRSTDGGERWGRWLVAHGAEILPFALTPGHPIVFAGVGGRVLRPLDRMEEVRAGERRPIWRAVALGDGGVRVTALAASPGHPDDRTVFAATSGGVFVSRDGGEHFTLWSDGLDTAIVSLVLSPDYAEDRLVYALGLGGTIWRRRDA